jgi:dihydroxyacetone kinase-like predicted kinase
MKLGTITKVAIENLIDQMAELERKARGAQLSLAPVEPGQIAVVAVSPGPGIARVFASLGVAAIVEGGQTMNPSTQDIINAFENLPTDKIIILPNNKNIILAAQAAAGLTVKQIAVIPSHNVPEGLAAMMHLIPNGDLEDVAEEMTAALKEVQTGEITTAIRSVEIEGVNVQEGEIIGLLNRKLVVSSDNLEQAVLELLERANVQNFELVTLFYGATVTKHEANHIGDAIRAAYPEIEVELQDGGQPHYQFIVSIE